MMPRQYTKSMETVIGGRALCTACIIAYIICSLIPLATIPFGFSNNSLVMLAPASMALWLADYLMVRYYPVFGAPNADNKDIISMENIKMRHIVSQLPVTRRTILEAYYRRRMPLLAVTFLAPLLTGICFIATDPDISSIWVLSVFFIQMCFSLISIGAAFRNGKYFETFRIISQSFLISSMLVNIMRSIDSSPEANSAFSSGIALIVLSFITLIITITAMKHSISAADGLTVSGEGTGD